MPGSSLPRWRDLTLSRWLGWAGVALSLAVLMTILARAVPALPKTPGHLVTDGYGKRVLVARKVEETAVFWGPGVGAFLLIARDPAHTIGTEDRYDRMIMRDPLLRRAFPELDAMTFPLSLHGPEAASIELLLNRQPTSIITVPWAAKIFRNIGLPALAIRIDDSEKGVIDAATMQAAVVGQDHRATDLVDHYKATMRDIASATRDQLRPRVLAIGADSSGRFWYSGRPFFDGFFAVVGAQDAAPARGYHRIDIERLLGLDPDVLLLLPNHASYPASLTDFEANAWARGLRAVRDRRVYAVPPLLVPLGADIIQVPLLAHWVAELLHPDLAGSTRAALIDTIWRELRTHATPAEIDRALAVTANTGTLDYERFLSANPDR